MAIEYLYDAIRATTGEEVTISAVITDDDGAVITDSCYMTLYEGVHELTKVYGAFDGEQWSFTIPTYVTVGLHGRYFYAIGRNFNDISFKTPIYFS